MAIYRVRQKDPELFFRCTSLPLIEGYCLPEDPLKDNPAFSTFVQRMRISFDRTLCAREVPGPFADNKFSELLEGQRKIEREFRQCRSFEKKRREERNISERVGGPLEINPYETPTECVKKLICSGLLMKAGRLFMSIRDKVAKGAAEVVPFPSPSVPEPPPEVGHDVTTPDAGRKQPRDGGRQEVPATGRGIDGSRRVDVRKRDRIKDRVGTPWDGVAIFGGFLSVAAGVSVPALIVFLFRRYQLATTLLSAARWSLARRGNLGDEVLERVYWSLRRPRQERLLRIERAWQRVRLEKSLRAEIKDMQDGNTYTIGERRARLLWHLLNEIVGPSADLHPPEGILTLTSAEWEAISNLTRGWKSECRFPLNLPDFRSNARIPVLYEGEVIGEVAEMEMGIFVDPLSSILAGQRGVPGPNGRDILNLIRHVTGDTDVRIPDLNEADALVIKQFLDKVRDSLSYLVHVF